MVLHAWQDCYENTARTEWLGIGGFDFKSSATHVDQHELVKAIKTVVHIHSFLHKAHALSKNLQFRRDILAAEYLMDIASDSMKLKDFKENALPTDTIQINRSMSYTIKMDRD